jgi:hypothetical protein
MMAAPDQQPAQSSCPAAKEVAGDVLLCADFSTIQSLTDPNLANWNFEVVPETDCWQIAGNTLTNKDVADLNFLCEASLPALNLTEPSLQKYNTFTLSIVYQIDLQEGQSAAVFLSSNEVQGGTMYWILDVGGSDIPNLPRTSTVAIGRASLPTDLNNVYRPLLQFTTQYKGIMSQGWEISSITARFRGHFGFL